MKNKIVLCSIIWGSLVGCKHSSSDAETSSAVSNFRSYTKGNFNACEIEWSYTGGFSALTEKLQQKGYKLKQLTYDETHNYSHEPRNYLKVYVGAKDWKDSDFIRSGGDRPTITETCTAAVHFKYSRNDTASSNAGYYNVIRATNTGPNLPGEKRYCPKAEKVLVGGIPNCNDLKISNEDYVPYDPNNKDLIDN